MKVQPKVLWLFLISALTHISNGDWSCPEIDDSTGISCHCDLPHTLRCSGLPLRNTSVTGVMDSLRGLPEDKSVSLLEISVLNLSSLPPNLFANVSLHGVVISSGELTSISPDCFRGLASNLSALGLPNNKLDEIPAFASDLSDLERLDLSSNLINVIRNNSFQSLTLLEVLDLSSNKISEIKGDAFVNVPNLKTLYLRDNMLTSILTTVKFSALKNLIELDLRGNGIAGALGNAILPRKLEALDLSSNNIQVLKRGMLSDLGSLTSLKLTYNQIDVIEDQAFISLKSLLSLDMSHNRIVSISTGSWTGLSSLTSLDLSHNFLRTITSDLTAGLSNLKSLVLADNDVSGVQGSFKAPQSLQNFVLNDNPFSCDCQLKEFVEWLQDERVNIDRGTAVCATPPRLENAQVGEVDTDLLTCNSEEMASTEYDSYEPVISSTGMLHFRNLTQDGAKVEVEWSVDSAKEAFTCDLLFVYKIENSHETLLEQIPVSCSTAKSELSSSLRLVFIAGAVLAPNAAYRLCLVLLEHHSGDDTALLPSCTDNFIYAGPKVESEGKLAFVIDDDGEEYENFLPDLQVQLTAFHANITTIDTLSVFMRISSSDCTINIGVFLRDTSVLQRSLNCSVQSVNFPNIPTGYYEYEVCATFEDIDDFSSKSRYQQCVVAKSPWSWSAENVLILVAVGFSFMFLSILILVLVYIFSRRLFFPKKPIFCTDRKSTSRNFLFPSSETENVYSDDLRQPRPLEIGTTLIQL